MSLPDLTHTPTSVPASLFTSSSSGVPPPASLLFSSLFPCINPSTSRPRLPPTAPSRLSLPPTCHAPSPLPPLPPVSPPCPLPACALSLSLPKYLMRHAPNHPFSHAARTSSPLRRATSTRPASSHPLTHLPASVCRAIIPSTSSFATCLASLSLSASPGLGRAPANSCRQCCHCLSSLPLSAASPAMAARAPSNISTTSSNPGFTLQALTICRLSPCSPCPPCITLLFVVAAFLI